MLLIRLHALLKSARKVFQEITLNWKFHYSPGAVLKPFSKKYVSLPISTATRKASTSNPWKVNKRRLPNRRGNTNGKQVAVLHCESSCNRGLRTMILLGGSGTRWYRKTTTAKDGSCTSRLCPHIFKLAWGQRTIALVWFSLKQMGNSFAAQFTWLQLFPNLVCSSLKSKFHYYLQCLRKKAENISGERISMKKSWLVPLRIRRISWICGWLGNPDRAARYIGAVSIVLDEAVAIHAWSGSVYLFWGRAAESREDPEFVPSYLELRCIESGLKRHRWIDNGVLVRKRAVVKVYGQW